MIIDRNTVKELLGITTTDYDVQIDRYIPIIDSKVKLITHNRYNYQVLGSITSGSNIIELYGYTNVTGGLQNHKRFDDIVDFLEYGSIITGVGIPSGSYITDIYYNSSSVEISSIDYSIPTIEISNDAESTNPDAQLFIGSNIGLQVTVAKGIMWLIDNESTSIPGEAVQSKSIGSISVSFGDLNSRIDGRYGMPVWFVKAFPSYMSGY